MDDPTQYLPAEESPAALAALFGSALVEYVFPPFPGDTVVVFGAFMVTARGWSGPAVFAATTLGGVVGAGIDWFIGVRLQRWRTGRTTPSPHIDRILTGFSRHGPAYIVINRFLPGIRALFFVAAGMAGMPARPVLLYATLSALLWNMLLMGVGLSVGASWEQLLSVFQAYTWVLWAAIGIAAVGVTGVTVIRSRQ